MFINRGIDNDVVRIHDGILLSASAVKRNKTGSFVEM